MSDPQPALVFKRKPCSQCGARTEKQAETMCTQSLGYDDEYHCAGEFDKSGWSVEATPESLKKNAEWWGRRLLETV